MYFLILPCKSRRWNGKIKINYVNGESEIISSRNGKNKYGMSVERYVIYNGKVNTLMQVPMMYALEFRALIKKQ